MSPLQDDKAYSEHSNTDRDVEDTQMCREPVREPTACSYKNGPGSPVERTPHRPQHLQSCNHCIEVLWEHSLLCVPANLYDRLTLISRKCCETAGKSAGNSAVILLFSVPGPEVSPTSTNSNLDEIHGDTMWCQEDQNHWRQNAGITSSSLR